MANKYIPNEIKRLVKERAKGCCEYCIAMSAFAFHPFAIEHILPIVKGGTNEISNLAFACQHCKSLYGV